MSEYVLGINPATDGAGEHDPSAALFKNSELIFGVEEERFTRQKHAVNTFPKHAIEACLNFSALNLSDISKVMISWKPEEYAKCNAKLALRTAHKNTIQSGYQIVQSIKTYSVANDKVENKLAGIGSPIPPVKYLNHHRCHAASAFYFSGLNKALILTVDGRGESDTTVVWRGTPSGMERVRTYKMPNSIGGFYGAVTEFLGYRINNGEGKVMGLAPYGDMNRDIREKFLNLIDIGVDYDVSELISGGIGDAVDRLEAEFGRSPKSDSNEFTDWEKDFAHVAQSLLEEIVIEIVETYCDRLSLNQLALAGGVALNCKMNKRLMELDVVDNIFIQPVAHDAGTAIGAGLLGYDSPAHDEMSTVYFGPEYTTSEIRETLTESKLSYSVPTDLEREIAQRLANGELVGWFQGRLEMGPRALGNRSILADPRTVESRDRVNKFVKHREEWRPFAPSVAEENAGQYLINYEPSPYMIKTFDLVEESKDQLQAVVHPGDETTRPQTVHKDQNPRYYRVIKEFEKITGTPVLLNTSFNDHGEPIVNSPKEAIKDFFGMGLDTLVLDDLIVDKKPNKSS